MVKKNHFFSSILSVSQLQRAWKAMKWIEKLSLVSSIFRGIASSSNISVNKLKVSLLDQHTTILVYIIFSMLISSFYILIIKEWKKGTLKLSL